VTSSDSLLTLALVTLKEKDRGYEAEDKTLSRKATWVTGAKWRKDATIQLVERRF